MDPPKNYFRTPQYLMDSVYNLLKVTGKCKDVNLILILKNIQTAELIGAQFLTSGLKSGFC